MINTFNLEQNLLTFPSERDILTGGSGSGGAVEDGWRDGRLFTCPRASVHAAALPARVPGHGASAAGETGLATLDAQCMNGTYDSRTGMHQGPWETLFLTIEGLVNSKTSMAECIVPPLVGAAVEGGDRMCPKPGRWAGLGTQGSGQHSPPPHTKPVSPLKSSNWEWGLSQELF